jgi:hypothetical protein
MFDQLANMLGLPDNPLGFVIGLPLGFALTYLVGYPVARHVLVPLALRFFLYDGPSPDGPGARAGAWLRRMVGGLWPTRKK